MKVLIGIIIIGLIILSGCSNINDDTADSICKNICNGTFYKKGITMYDFEADDYIRCISNKENNTLSKGLRLRIYCGKGLE